MILNNRNITEKANLKAKVKNGLIIIFQSIHLRNILKLFPQINPEDFVHLHPKFLQLIKILDMSMKDISESWSLGKPSLNILVDFRFFSKKIFKGFFFLLYKRKTSIYCRGNTTFDSFAFPRHKSKKSHFR